MAQCSMQDIFNQHFDSYAKQRTLHARERRAAWCIRNCFTAAIGSHALVCPAGHFTAIQHHACGHRSCPRCAERPRQLWMQAQLQRLLPCPHFHVVFTLPHQFLPLWSFNRQAMTSLLFECVRDTLLQLMADPKRAGVRPALFMALHTWGRTLSHHPHIHCLLSAGGINADGKWQHTSAKFLLPLKPLQALFRGKFLARLRSLLTSSAFVLPPQQGLTHWLDCIKPLYRKHWNIEIQPPYEHARGVAVYLARYAKGGPVPSTRKLSVHANGMVRMGYTDHRDGRSKTLCIHAHEFIARVLWHAPPKGQHTVRYAGLYSSAYRVQYQIARTALSMPAPAPAPAPAPLPQSVLALPLQLPPPAPHDAAQLCPVCNWPLRRQAAPVAVQAHHRGAFSKARPQPPPAHTAHLGPTRRSSGIQQPANPHC
jgi:Putative transposase/Transposase zinc-binding domain